MRRDGPAENHSSPSRTEPTEPPSLQLPSRAGRKCRPLIFDAKIGDRAITVLLDSGASSNFIRTAVADHDDDIDFLLTAQQLKKARRRGEDVYLLQVRATDKAVEQDGIDEQDLELRARLERDYGDVFADAMPPGLPPERQVNHKIILQDGATPEYRPAYRLSPNELEELNRQLKMLVERGLIEPASSPWGAPVLD